MYLAPEVFRGEHYDESADVFSFGIICCAVAQGGDITEFFKGAFERQGILTEKGVSGMTVPSKIALGWRPDFPEEWEEELPSLTKVRSCESRGTSREAPPTFLMSSQLIRQCLHPAYAHRPKFEEIHSILERFWETNEEYMHRSRSITKMKAGDDVSSEFQEECVHSMTMRTKKAKARLDDEINPTVTSEYANMKAGELHAVIENKESENVQMRLLVSSLSECLPTETVSEIKQKGENLQVAKRQLSKQCHLMLSVQHLMRLILLVAVRDSGRRISQKRRKSQLLGGTTDDSFRFDLQSMAKKTPTPGRLQKAESRRTVIALQSQEYSPVQSALRARLSASRENSPEAPKR